MDWLAYSTMTQNVQCPVVYTDHAIRLFLFLFLFLVLVLVLVFEVERRPQNESTLQHTVEFDPIARPIKSQQQLSYVDHGKARVAPRS
jgi:hypothetical protein